jgi:hypothetical protein
MRNTARNLEYHTHTPPGRSYWKLWTATTIPNIKDGIRCRIAPPSHDTDATRARGRDGVRIPAPVAAVRLLSGAVVEHWRP